jgi:hypothetical protein
MINGNIINIVAATILCFTDITTIIKKNIHRIINAVNSIPINLLKSICDIILINKIHLLYMKRISKTKQKY